MSKKEDRRIVRTRRRLSEALLALIMEKAYEAITIQEIAERADLNRATFYLHYSNKEELLVASLEARFDDLVAGFAALNPTALPIWEDQAPERLTFRHVAENAALYKVLLSERGMGYIVYRIIDYIAAYGQARMAAELPAGAKTAVPPELLSQHAAGSLFALVSWWIQNDMPYPPEYMAEITHQLACSGVMPFVKLSAPDGL